MSPTAIAIALVLSVSFVADAQLYIGKCLHLNNLLASAIAHSLTLSRLIFCAEGETIYDDILFTSHSYNVVCEISNKVANENVRIRLGNCGGDYYIDNYDGTNRVASIDLSVHTRTNESVTALLPSSALVGRRSATLVCCDKNETIQYKEDYEFSVEICQELPLPDVTVMHGVDDKTLRVYVPSTFEQEAKVGCEDFVEVYRDVEIQLKNGENGIVSVTCEFKYYDSDYCEFVYGAEQSFTEVQYNVTYTVFFAEIDYKLLQTVSKTGVIQISGNENSQDFNSPSCAISNNTAVITASRMIDHLSNCKCYVSESTAPHCECELSRLADSSMLRFNCSSAVAANTATSCNFLTCEVQITLSPIYLLIILLIVFAFVVIYFVCRRLIPSDTLGFCHIPSPVRCKFYRSRTMYDMRSGSGAYASLINPLPSVNIKIEHV